MYGRRIGQRIFYKFLVDVPFFMILPFYQINNRIFTFPYTHLKSDKSQVEKLAESFLRSRQETEQLVAKQKLALGAFYKRGKLLER